MRFLLTAAVLSLCAPAARADDAKAVVEKAVKAAGVKPGEAVLTTWKDRGTFNALGTKMDYTGDWAFAAPDKYRFAIDADLGGMKVKITVVTNGNKAWQSSMGRTEEITGEKLDYVLTETYQLHVIQLAPLLTDNDFKLSDVPGKEVGGKKTAGVKVAREKRPDVVLYFDAATGLLAKMEVKVKDEFQGWKEVLDETYFEDYKDAGGKKVAGKLRIVRDGKPMIESNQAGHTWPAKLDPKTFDKP